MIHNHEDLWWMEERPCHKLAWDKINVARATTTTRRKWGNSQKWMNDVVWAAENYLASLHSWTFPTENTLWIVTERIGPNHWLWGQWTYNRWSRRVTTIKNRLKFFMIREISNRRVFWITAIRNVCREIPLFFYIPWNGIFFPQPTYKIHVQIEICISQLYNISASSLLEQDSLFSVESSSERNTRQRLDIITYRNYVVRYHNKCGFQKHFSIL